jgi:hypothetical protein
METCLLKTPTTLYSQIGAGRSSINLPKEKAVSQGDIIYLVEQLPNGTYPGNRLCRIAGTVTEHEDGYTVELWPVKEYEIPRRTKWQSNKSRRKRA